MFIAAEMVNRERKIAEVEIGKKVRIDFHAMRNAALIVLYRLEHELGNDIPRLCNKELEVLLKWKGIALSKMGNMTNK